MITAARNGGRALFPYAINQPDSVSDQFTTHWLYSGYAVYISVHSRNL